MILKILICVFAALAEAERLKEAIYVPFPSTSIKACFRRLNGTMEIGCTSDFSGNVGVLLYVDSNDISEVEMNEYGPYIVLISPDVFSGTLLERMKATGNVNGIILPSVKEGKWKGKMPARQSEDSECPNQGSSLYDNTAGQCGSTDSTWNPGGEDLLWRNWDFPIFLIDDANTTQSLYDCYQKFNSGSEKMWPLCSVEMMSPMYAAKDSETCFRRSNFIATLEPQQYCEPVSDYNIYYFTSPRNGTHVSGGPLLQKEKSVLLVVARLDALNMFDREEIGFDSPSTGIVTLMATAHAIKKAVIESYKDGFENILFMLLHGESLDYLGSNRIIYDMTEEAFPYKLEKDLQDSRILSNGRQPLFNLDNIKLIIELGQLSNLQSDTMYYHSHNVNDDITSIIQSLSTSSVKFESATSKFLPPSSVHTFLKKRSDIPVILLTNFDKQYKNLYFHSIYDNAIVHNYNSSLGDDQRSVVHLTSLATSLASAILNIAANHQKSPQGDKQLVNRMLECLVETRNCSLYRDVARADPQDDYIKVLRNKLYLDEPFAQYVSVRASFHTIMTKQVLQYITGDIVDSDCNETAKCKDECFMKNKDQQIYVYNFFTGSPKCLNGTDIICGKCYKTTVATKYAISPAFEPDIWKTYDWTSGKYPSWTESYWKSISGRMFLQPSPAYQHTTLAAGLIVALLSFPITYWLQKKSTVMFLNDGSTATSGQSNPQPVAL